MAELPGYKCTLKVGQDQIGLTSEDVRVIREVMGSVVSGQRVPFALSSGTIFCRNNTFAEPPGFRCSK